MVGSIPINRWVVVCWFAVCRRRLDPATDVGLMLSLADNQIGVMYWLVISEL